MKSVIKVKPKTNFTPYVRATAQYRDGDGNIKVVVVVMETDKTYPDKDFWKVMCLYTSGDCGWSLFEVCGAISFDSPGWEKFEGALEITV